MINRKYFINKPYEAFKLLRHSNNLLRLEDTNIWLIANYSDIKRVLTAPQDFSSNIMEEPTYHTDHFFLKTRGLVGMDPPLHRMLRRSVSNLFTTSKLATYDNLLHETSRECMHELKSYSSINVIEDFATPFPILIIFKLLGLNLKHVALYKRWIQLLLRWQRTNEKTDAIAVSNAIFGHLIGAIHAKRYQGQNDWLSYLCHQNLNDLQIIAMVRLLFVAGSDTITKSICNGVYYLVTHPEVAMIIRQSPSMLDDFVDELLRHNGPVIGLLRKASVDVEINQTTIRCDDLMLALVASANHDECVFNEPEQFNLYRHRKQHLSFGLGIHYCLGARLAKMQLKVAFEHFLNIIDDFQAVSTNVSYTDSLLFRGVNNLILRRSHDCRSTFS